MENHARIHARTHARTHVSTWYGLGACIQESRDQATRAATCQIDTKIGALRNKMNQEEAPRNSRRAMQRMNKRKACTQASTRPVAESPTQMLRQRGGHCGPAASSDCINHTWLVQAMKTQKAKTDTRLLHSRASVSRNSSDSTAKLKSPAAAAGNKTMKVEQPMKSTHKSTNQVKTAGMLKAWMAA